MPAIRGVPPTSEQKQLIKAAESLGPDKSLANLDASARLVLTSVVLVASVLTGFGLFADVSARLRAQPLLLGLPIGLAILSAVLAIFALVPWMWRVDVDDLKSISSAFTLRIRVRGTLVIFAMLLLIGAIAAAAYGAGQYLAGSDASDHSLTLTRAMTGDGPTVTAAVQVNRAPAGSVAEVTVTSPASSAAVFSAVQRVGNSGDVKIEAEVPKSAASEELTLTFVLRQGGTVLITDSTQLSGTP